MAADSSDSVPQLVHDAIITLLQTTDYRKITVRAVTQEAGIARSSFYRYYESIDDAFRQIEDAFFEQIEQINRISLQVGRDAEDARHPSESIIARLEIIRANRELVLALDGPHGNPDFHARAEELFAGYFRRRFAEVNADEATIQLSTAFLAEGHYALVRTWLEKYPEVSARRIGELTNLQFYAFYLD